MKIAKFLAFAAMGAVAFSAVSCGDDDDDDNNPVTPAEAVITLSSSTASVEVGKTITLTATTANVPDGTAIVWTSSDDRVATVADGTVTGVAAGTATISAAAAGKTATCKVTVSENGDGDDNNDKDAPSLQGSNYYVFFLDATSTEKIKGKIDGNFSIDDVFIHWYIWENTYAAQDPVGKNFYGVAGEGWMAMTVGQVGWSGAGWACDSLPEMNKLAAVYNNPEGYYFHVAMKSTDNASHCMIFGGTDSEVKIAIGGDYVDNGTTYVKYADLTRDGEWNEIEIPMSDLFDKGLVYGDNNTKGANLVSFLSGGVSGTSLQFDAMFIYKKK